MEIINRFEMSLKREEVAEKTIAAYKNDLLKFFDYVKNVLDVGIDEESLQLIEYRDLENFVYYLEQEKKYARATINRVVMALKSFYGYYGRYTNVNPTRELRGFKKVNSKEKKALTKDEVVKIINQTQRKRYDERFVDFNSQRDRFLLSLLATTGLRIEEALSIKFEDIDSYDGYKMVNINTHEGETKLNKRVPICGKVLDYYNSYMLEYEKKFDIKNDNYVIVSARSGKKLCTKSSNTMIRKYCGELNIDDVTNHCFRHYANVALMVAGTPDTIRKKILGWSCNGDMGASVYFHNNEEIDKIMANYCSKVLE